VQQHDAVARPRGADPRHPDHSRDECCPYHDRQCRALAAPFQPITLRRETDTGDKMEKTAPHRTAVAIVGVAVDENIDDVVRFVRQHELRYPVLVGSEALARAHGVEVYPTLVIRRPGGASRIGHVGVASDQALQGLLGAGAAADGAEPGGR